MRLRVRELKRIVRETIHSRSTASALALSGADAVDVIDAFVDETGSACDVWLSEASLEQLVDHLRMGGQLKSFSGAEWNRDAERRLARLRDAGWRVWFEDSVEDSFDIILKR